MEYKIVCSGCSQGTEPLIIPIKKDDEEVYCPVCNRRYRIVTREIKSPTSEKKQNNRYVYSFQSKEDKERWRPRSFEAQADIRLRTQMTITLVKRGAVLVGIADQTNTIWYEVQPKKTENKRLENFFTYFLGAAFLAALIQFFHVTDYFQNILQKEGLSVFIILLVAVLILCIPAIVWAIEASRQEEKEGNPFA